MIVSDKTVLLGLNAAAAVGFGYLYRGDLTNRALGTVAGGIAASSLFQTYYPEYSYQIEEKLGSNLTQALTWFHPGVILLAGYLGGVPFDVNMLALQFFIPIHFCLGWYFWNRGDERKAQEIEAHAQNAQKNIEQHCLQAASEALRQAEALAKTLATSEKYYLAFSGFDRAKRSLISAYLHLETPKIEEAEKWVHTFSKRPVVMIHYFYELISVLMERDKNEATKQHILKLIRECEEIDGPRSILSLKYTFAKTYELPELIEEVRKTIATLKPTRQDIEILFRIASEGLQHKDDVLAKACLEKGEALLSEFKEEKSKEFPTFWGNISREAALIKIFPNIDDLRAKMLWTDKSCVSKITYSLIKLALDLEENAVAERLLHSGKLQQEDPLLAHLEMACAFGKTSLDQAREEIASAFSLIEAWDLPSDIEERKETLKECRSEAFLSVIRAQAVFDPEGAYATAQEKLSSLSMHHQFNAFLTLAETCERAQAQKALAHIDTLNLSLSKWQTLRLERVREKHQTRSSFWPFG